MLLNLRLKIYHENKTLAGSIGSWPLLSFFPNDLGNGYRLQCTSETSLKNIVS